MLKQFVGPYAIEARKLFRLVLFNYAFSNGDAQLKDFSLLETDRGDFILSPAYDLVCSRIHVKDTDVAFKNGLFADEYETESYKANAYYAYDDFYALGTRAGLSESLVKQEIQSFIDLEETAAELIGRSFLDDSIKSQYLQEYQNKLERFKYSYLATKQKA